MPISFAGEMQNATISRAFAARFLLWVSFLVFYYSVTPVTGERRRSRRNPNRRSSKFTFYLYFFLRLNLHSSSFLIWRSFSSFLRLIMFLDFVFYLSIQIVSSIGRFSPLVVSDNDWFVLFDQTRWSMLKCWIGSTAKARGRKIWIEFRIGSLGKRLREDVWS